mmetsp:Transcript_14313/g.39807  ORF Transcript_14313/g.39807 Transcript_14313/m.39807 type:complete len:510 (-) Transcript_14313:118-1647(-)
MDPNAKNTTAGWLEQCPVQETDPDIEIEAESLVPGDALMKCSGKDIHLQKGAMKKSKYLALLPGLLSFNEKKKDENNPPVVLSQDTVETQLSQETSESVDVDEDKGTAAQQGDQQGLISLGNIENLASGHPTLSLPFPRSSKVLQMSGRQMSTSSRFLVLSVKKGKVTCKHIFDSAIVFGNPVIVEGTTTGSEDIFENDLDGECDGKQSSINHYGCSVRPLEERRRSSTPVGETAGNGDDDDDESTAESESARVAEDTTPDAMESRNSTRRSPRRETRKTVKYGEGSSEEDDDDVSNGDSSEEKGKKVHPARRKRIGGAAPKNGKRQKIASTGDEDQADKRDEHGQEGDLSNTESSAFEEEGNSTAGSNRAARTNSRIRSKNSASESERPKVLVLSSEDDSTQSDEKKKKEEKRRSSETGEIEKDNRKNAMSSEVDESSSRIGAVGRKQREIGGLSDKDTKTEARIEKTGGTNTSPSPRRRRKSSQGRSPTKKMAIDLMDEDGLDFLQK